MSQATNTHTPTRRRALSGAAAVTAGLAATIAAPTLASVNRDAELLELCAEFHRQHAAAIATDEWDDDGLAAALDVRWGISDQIEDISATTDAGRIAKAKVAIFLLEENRGPDAGSESSDLYFAIAALRDIAGSAEA